MFKKFCNNIREKHVIMFDEPVLLQSNHWYVAWARISGPSSDCGSNGQSTVFSDDQFVNLIKLCYLQGSICNTVVKILICYYLI